MKRYAGKVLMLLENNPYPEDTRVRNEANSLTKKGYKVLVICPSASTQPNREIIDGVSVYRYPFPNIHINQFNYIFEYAFSLILTFYLTLIVFFHEGFDVIHAHCPPDALVFIGAFYRNFGKKIVYDHHDLSPELYNARFGSKSNLLIYNLLKFIEKLACRLADHVIATNQSYKKLEMQRGKIPSERITIVRNGPDLKIFKPVELQQDYRYKEKVIIGYAGIIGPQDGVDYLLRVLNHMIYEIGRNKILCLILGDGDAYDKMLVLASDLKLHDYVHFTGRVEHRAIPKYLGLVDVCVSPDPSNEYNDQSTSIKMMEYMALQKPIVSFDLPENRFTAQGSALYAQPNNEHDFAKKLITLMDNPEMRRLMGRIGRNRIEEELSWANQEINLLEVYQLIS